jgi:hypothetical protein
MIKILTVEFATWMVEGAGNVKVIGEYATHDEAVSGIWMHLVQTRQHHAYLMFQRHPLLRRWQPLSSMFWGTLQNGVPRMYQEQLDPTSAKRAFKIYKP